MHKIPIPWNMDRPIGPHWKFGRLFAALRGGLSINGWRAMALGAFIVLGLPMPILMISSVFSSSAGPSPWANAGSDLFTAIGLAIIILSGWLFIRASQYRSGEQWYTGDLKEWILVPDPHCPQGAWPYLWLGLVQDPDGLSSLIATDYMGVPPVLDRASLWRQAYTYDLAPGGRGSNGHVRYPPLTVSLPVGTVQPVTDSDRQIRWRGNRRFSPFMMEWHYNTVHRQPDSLLATESPPQYLTGKERRALIRFNRNQRRQRCP